MNRSSMFQRKKTQQTFTQPLVSTLMPSYNRAHFLKSAIESIAAQSYSNIEVILVDDGSVDETQKAVREICKETAQRRGTDWIHYIKQEHSGISAARNRALSEARGTLIAFLDSDDLWVPDKIEKQVQYRLLHPDCHIVFCQYQNFMNHPGGEPSHKELELASVVIQHYMAGALIDKQLFDIYGGFSEALKTGEDTEWVTRIRMLGVSLDDCIDEPLYLRRIHSDNITLIHWPEEDGRLFAAYVTSIRNAQRIRRKGHENLGIDPRL